MWWWPGKKAEHTEARTRNVHHLQRPDLFPKSSSAFRTANLQEAFRTQTKIDTIKRNNKHIVEVTEKQKERRETSRTIFELIITEMSQIW